jgi:hypothetical protein
MDTMKNISWLELNDVLRSATQKHCERLLKEERAGKKRVQYLKRIHSRLNKARADRERQELV